MKVTAEGADVQNGQTLVGALEPGGYFPLDALLTPMTAGQQNITITINYTDDFNQPREIVETLTVEVMDAPPIDPGIGPDGMPIDPGLNPDGGFPPDGMPVDSGTSGSLWDKVLRFFKGLFGLDSGPSTPGGEEMPPLDGMPVEPMPSEGKPLPKG
jgi:hypothetical protein